MVVASEAKPEAKLERAQYYGGPLLLSKSL